MVCNSMIHSNQNLNGDQDHANDMIVPAETYIELDAQKGLNLPGQEVKQSRSDTWVIFRKNPGML
jgi:hypothetical protein